MSLQLTKYRKANHNHVAVGGSYTDTFIEAQAKSPTSSSATSYIRWVPNNKNGSYLPGVSTANLDSDGYLSYDNSNASGYTVLRWAYFDDSNAYNGGNTSPGIRLASIDSYQPDSYTELGPYLTDIMAGVFGDCVFAIVSSGRIGSHLEIYNGMVDIRSWRHTRIFGSSGTLTNYTYVGIGTNVNGIGLLSESLQGQATGHINALSELVIEHDATTLGHAGYGEELSSGVGSGELTLNTQNTTSSLASKYLYWNNPGRENVQVGENVRVTFSGKVGQYGAQYNGFAGVRLTEQGQSPVTILTQSTDAFANVEFDYQRQSPSSAHLLIQPYGSTGSGTGAGDYYQATVRNVEVFKCGNNPDQSRDVAVHKWHINALNISEGPADFNITNPQSFYDFYISDRNLMDTTIGYALDTSGTSVTSALANYQTRKGTYPSYGDLGYVNWVRWFDRNVGNTSTAATQQHFKVKEIKALTSNQTSNYSFGFNAFGLPIDHTKMYMAGVWVRVREVTHTGTGQAPCRISMTAGILDSNYQQDVVYDWQGQAQLSGYNYYTSSVHNQNISGATNEWKLMSQFYLPSFFEGADFSDWHDNYWGTWAGEYEWGEGNNPAIQLGRYIFWTCWR